MGNQESFGLPDGVRLVRIGTVGLEEWEWREGTARMGPSQRTSCIVVALNPGWEFFYDIQTDAHVPVKVFDDPERFTLNLVAKNGRQLDVILGLKARAQKEGLLDESPVQEATVPQGIADEEVREVDPRPAKSGTGAARTGTAAKKSRVQRP